MRHAESVSVCLHDNRQQFENNIIRVHKFTINKNAKMNQTMYETIINCIFVFMMKIVIPVNTDYV